jgi:transposase
VVVRVATPHWTSERRLRFNRSVDQTPPTSASQMTTAAAALDAARPDCPGCQALAAVVQDLLTRVEQLEARLNQNSRNSSRPPSADPPSAPPGEPKQKGSGRNPGGQPGHPGRTRELKPSEACAASFDYVPSHCDHCHAALPQHATEQDPAPVRHQVTDVPPVVVETIEHRLHARTCPACRRRTWASLPEEVPKTAVGPRLQAIGALLTGGYRVSRRDVEALFFDLFGEPISLGTISAMEANTAAALSVPYQEVAEAVAQAEVANVDETRWWEKHRLAWLWLAATPALALFRIDAHRSREAFERLLPPTVPGQERTVGTDRYSAYAHLFGDDRAICWSHLDRDFQGWVEARGVAAAFGERALALTDQLFEAWHLFRAGEFDRPELCERLLPVQGAFRELFEAAHASGHWKVAGPARELLKHWGALWTFSRREGVEPTNNHAERVLRHAVRWRKGSFGHQSEQGRTFVERTLTVVTSLRLQGRNVLAYLEAAIRASLTGTTAPSLLPAPVA